MKWYLVSEPTVRRVQEALQTAINHTESDCGASGCLCDLNGVEHSKFYKDALHELDTDCHTTDAVPSDWVIEREDENTVSPTLAKPIS